MIGSLLYYVLYPVSRYLTGRRSEASAVVIGTAVCDGAAVTSRRFSPSQTALLDLWLRPSSRGSKGERIKDPNSEKLDDTRPDMDKALLMAALHKHTQNDTASKMREVQPAVMQEETGKSHTPQQEEVEAHRQGDVETMHHQLLYCKEKTERESISPAEDWSLENILKVQFICLQTKDSIQELSHPPQEQPQTQNLESLSPKDRMQETSSAAENQINKTNKEIPQTAAEPECWDEYVLPNTDLPQGEASNSQLAFVPLLSNTETTRQHNAQSSLHFPVGRGLVEEVQCPLWHFPAMSYYPPEEATVPFEVIWRVWEKLDESAAAEDSTLIPFPLKKVSVEFTVMSYNILAQDLLEANQELYIHCPLEVLDWSYRCSLLLEEIEKWLPDILCLQEVQENHYHEQLHPALSQIGYTCVYKRRTGTKTDGCATCYRSTCFSEVAATQLEFFRPETELLDRHNVGIVLLLRPLVSHGSEVKEEAPPLCVANTHLLFNPRRGDVKLAQLAIMLAEIDSVIKRCKAKGEHCNVILCGDFNSIPHMPLYQLITTSELYYQGLPAWMISGQEDLSHKAYCHRLFSPLWPSCLEITNNCQYTTVNETFKCQNPGKSRYSHDFMLQLRFCPAACVRPQDLKLIPGVTDITPEASKGSQHFEQRFGHRLSHRLNLESVYKHVLPGSGRPEVTTLHSEVGQTVDYIFYTPRCAPDKKAVSRLASEGLKLVGSLSLLSEDVLWSMHGLPNHIFPSDHLSLMAKFQLDVDTV
ncbi:protein angel homolog 1 [Parambassis ranga]|uniref:Protein angel homolog 1 n=1 Tax=Parambassis ranga TaxID=210632 RepID=A0A6P7H923_9TELE|nr:protein angel homolog 1 [Parambassis ranga]